jgi:3-methyladenine DNA glycosylase AlkD
MGKARAVPIDPVADLKRRLSRAAGDRSGQRARTFWTRYLRGAAKFRGVPMGRVRSCVHAWWDDHGLAAHPPAVGKRIALALLEQTMTEDKLAGILLLQELLAEELHANDLPAFALLFERGHLADWNVVDWFSVKVLVPLLEQPGARTHVARAIAAWRDADTTWQRRAACVAFTQLAARGDAAMPGVTDLILEICATVVWSPERFDQTAVGWLLRELSRAEPERVAAFFRRHARFMTKECARYAVAKFPTARRTELLAHHKRATSLRRS